MDYTCRSGEAIRYKRDTDSRIAVLAVCYLFIEPPIISMEHKKEGNQFCKAFMNQSGWPRTCIVLREPRSHSLGVLQELVSAVEDTLFLRNDNAIQLSITTTLHGLRESKGK